MRVATPSFWRAVLDGLASLTIFPPEFPPPPLTPREAREADAAAIAGDWRAVGDDLRAAMREYERGKRS